MIRVNNLYKTYDRHLLNSNTVLKDISFTLPDTGFVCILGPSGCGKTSLLNAIGGLDKFDEGTIETGRTRVHRYGTRAYEAERNRSFGYIFQNYYLLMEHSVAYNVYLGLHNLKLSHREKLQRVQEALQAVEMERYLRRTVGELSGGQQQRVAIARALARKPRVIFADEPTGNLDEANTLNICSLLRRISKTSLVVMVTHEERIANFFADRIITLREGRISDDQEIWERDGLITDTSATLYAGDYPQECVDIQGLKLRYLRQEDAPEVELTVLALRDRIVIKLSDGRTVTCGAPAQAPELKEGPRPVLTLESVENQMPQDSFSAVPQKHTFAGRGLTFPMQYREAKQLGKGKGMRRFIMRLFLLLLSMLTAFAVSDYLTVASINPEEFITTHSQILEIEIGQGSTVNPETNYTTTKIQEFLEYLNRSGMDYEFIPHVALTAEYSASVMPQLDSVSMNFGKFSYAPLSELDESTLIAGRMPENSEEIVVDRWLLDAAIAEDGIIQNSIHDNTYFLGCRLTYPKRTYSPTVVGICDSGEPAIYLNTAGMISIGVNGVAVMPLSQLQQLDREQFGALTLQADECFVITNTAGETFAHRVGGTYSTSQRKSYTIKDAFEADIGAHIIVADDQLDELLADMYSNRFYLYCQDKAAMLELLAKQASPGERAGYTKVTVTDRYSSDMTAYQEATSQKLDARSIVTVTVMALSMVMLYLLCRAQTQSRIGMLAVYRLLGIPKRKLTAIFAMESVLCSLRTALPGTALVWAVIRVLSSIEELGISMVFPWQAALAVYGSILVFHLLVSTLPSRHLLRLPPAQLAAKYDL